MSIKIFLSALKMKGKFKQDRAILLILLMFFLIKLLVLSSFVRWDEAVYIGMGKYLFSLGKTGLWEPARPLVLPALQGALWFSGLNPVFFGKILMLFFSVGYIYLSYLIAKELFSEKVAVLSSILIAFSPVFFFFSSFAMSGIIATFFVLAGFYFFIKKNYFLSGLFFSLGFMTRFLMLFALVGVLIVFLFKFKIKDIARFCSGFLIFFAPYLIFNYFLYGSFIYPFVLQGFMTSVTGFVFHKAWWHYFFWLFKENFLVYLSVIAIFVICWKSLIQSLSFLYPSGISEHAQKSKRFLTFKKRKTEELALISIPLVFLVFYTIIQHKEERFMLTFLPFLYVLTSFSVFYLISRTKKFRNYLIGLVILIILVNWSVQFKMDNGPSYYDYMRDYLKNPDIKGAVWISNPVFAVDSEHKVDGLMYYPTFNHDKFFFLKNNLESAEHVLLNTCDLYCEPYNEFCGGDKIELISLLKSNLDTIFYDKENGCESYIFRS